jgi:carbon monoxide dehydrogenase subunit G
VTGLPLVWGATPDEVARRYPSDDLVPNGVAMTRAISVAAPPELVWQWLCQMAVAPYSYDWIDNFGRRSPQTLTPGADQLELGQRMAVVFELVAFDAPHQWTGLTTPRGQRMFGPVAMSFAAEPDGADTRIVGRLVAGAGGPLARVRAQALAWGDLVMMRRQFLNFKALAERDAIALGR